LADIDAEPRISKAVKGVVVPIPTLPELIIRLAAGVIVRFPEELERLEAPPIDNLLVGFVVPIPTLPLLERYITEVNPVSPPTDVWKLRELLFKKLKVFAPAFPIGTANDRFPEMVAVGVPWATLIKANLADVVACPPMKKSTVELLG
jgi:hypothetical protein